MSKPYVLDCPEELLTEYVLPEPTWIDITASLVVWLALAIRDKVRWLLNPPPLRQRQVVLLPWRSEDKLWG